MLRAKSAVLVLYAVLALSTASVAQSPGGQGGSRGGMGGGRDGPRPDAMRSAPAADAPLNPGAMVQKQLDQLEDELKLGAAQRDAWNAYADKVQKLADEVARSRFEARASTPGPSSAAEQLDRIAGTARSRTTVIEDIAGLGRAFYAALTPEQKRVADARLALPLSLLATGMAPPRVTDSPSRAGAGSSP